MASNSVSDSVVSSSQIILSQNIETPVTTKRQRETDKANQRYSPVWNYIEEYFDSKQKNSRRVRCKLCNKSWVFHGSTTNMSTHMQKVHGIILQEDGGDGNVHSDTEENEESINTDVAMINRPQKACNLDLWLMKFIISACCPFRIVENQYFKNFVYALNKHYQLPCRQYLSGKLLNEIYLSEKENMMKEFEDATAVCLTLDLWLSIQLYTYIGVTIHFIDSTVSFRNKTIAVHHLPQEHTTNSIVHHLSNILDDWNLTSKIVAVVADNASNVRNIAEALCNKLETI